MSQGICFTDPLRTCKALPGRQVTSHPLALSADGFWKEPGLPYVTQASAASPRCGALW